VLDYGIGLTDVVKHRAESSDARLRPEDFGPGAFVEKILDCEPTVVALTARGPGPSWRDTWVSRRCGSTDRARGRSARRACLPAAFELAFGRGDRKGQTAAWVSFGDWIRILDGQSDT